MSPLAILLQAYAALLPILAHVHHTNPQNHPVDFPAFPRQVGRTKQAPPAAIENTPGRQFAPVPALEFMMGSDQSPESLMQPYPQYEQSAQGKEKLLQGRSIWGNVFIDNRVRQPPQ